MSVPRGTAMEPLLDAIVGDARRAAASGDLAAIDRASQRIDETLHRLPPGSRLREQVQRLAAETALVRHQLQPACTDLARRAEALAALDLADAPERRLRDLTLARLRAELGFCGDARALDDARRLLRALTARDDANVAVRREAALALGAVAWRAGDGHESASAYEVALDAGMAAVDALTLRPAREAELRLSSEAAPRAALAHARDGHPWRAAETVELGRAVLMDPFRQRGDRRATARAAIERAASGASLVYLVPTVETGLAIVVGRRGITTLDLPGFTTEAVAKRLDRVIDREQARIRVGTDEWFSDVGAWAWTAAMGRVQTAVDDDQVVLVSCGLASALPLHAAWRPVGERRRYLLEDVVIRYAPNARWASADRAERRGRHTRVLAVANPRNGLPPLRHAKAEIKAIPESLKRECWTSRPEVLQRWREFDIIHFACHGHASVDDPLHGGVVLDDDLTLTAQHVIDRKLDAHPLVILSACETAVIGARLPDEVVSLQSAFLAAGASGVVATLWPVDDENSARLVGRFYEELVVRGRSPATALRDSQRWMAAATDPPASAWPRKVMRHRPRRPAPTWAAFTYAGV